MNWSFAANEPETASQNVPAQSLIGDFQTMLLDDVLLWIAARKKSGTLHCRRRSTRKQIVFQGGALQSCSSNDPRETLGQVLLKEQLISEEHLFRALERQERQSGTLLGVLLVSEGRISAEQLCRTLRAKAEQVVYDLFLWGDGGFFFEENSLPHSVPLNLGLDTQAVVQEGTRRRARWQRIRETFVGGDVTFRALSEAALTAGSAEQRIYELAKAGKTLAEISLETRRSEFETAEYLHALCELQLLAADRAVGEPEAADTVGAIEQLFAMAGRAVQERSLAEAFEAYQDVLGLDPLNMEARKGLVAVSDARKRERISKQVALDRVPEIRMGSLALAKERLSAEEGFALSRVNGKWDVQSILKLCPLPEEQVLSIFSRLLDRKVIELR